jgi:hypothetical protein
MTSQINTFVPIMDSTNYQLWVAQMQSYLLAQGQWKVVKGGQVIPRTGKDKDGKPIITDQEKYNEWTDISNKALGNIHLRLHHTIGYQFSATDDPSTLWVELKKRYSNPGVVTAFVCFKTIIDTQIPGNADPSPALDKIMSHIVQLREMKWDISDRIIAMILLSKASQSMESLVQLIAAKISESEDNQDIEKILAVMRGSWETHRRQGAKGKQNTQQSNKLSTVKEYPGQPPQFQQQQQQQRRDEDFQGRGRGR